MKQKMIQLKYNININYDNNCWVANCKTFDIKYSSKKLETTIKRIHKLIELYIDGLNKYNFPKHLIYEDDTI